MRVTQILSMPVETLDRVILLGPPGIGKTEIVRQKAELEAKKRNKKFVELRKLSKEERKQILANPDEYYVYHRLIATHVFPEDVNIPRDSGDFIIFKEPLTLRILCECEGLLFIDELTNVQRADQRTFFYSLIQEKEVGWDTALNDKLTIIAAGNKPEHSEDATPLPNPLENRMTLLEVDPPTVEEWGNYMDVKHKDNWDRRTLAFLTMFPGELFRLSQEPFQQSATPRSWTRLATRLPLLPSDEEVVLAYMTGTIGFEAAQKFAGFMRTSIPPVQEFLSSPATYWSNFNLNQKALMTFAVSQQFKKLVEKDKDKMLGLMNFLADSDRDSLILLMKLIPTKDRMILLKDKDFFNIFKSFTQRILSILTD